MVQSIRGILDPNTLKTNGEAFCQQLALCAAIRKGQSMKSRTPNFLPRRASRVWASVSLLSAMLGLALMPATGTAARNPNPRVLPTHSQPYGKSYGDWAVAWWQWALSIPEAQNPVTDTTGEFCHVGQS